MKTVSETDFYCTAIEEIKSIVIKLRRQKHSPCRSLLSFNFIMFTTGAKNLKFGLNTVHNFKYLRHRNFCRYGFLLAISWFCMYVYMSTHKQLSNQVSNDSTVAEIVPEYDDGITDEAKQFIKVNIFKSF